MRTGEIYIPDGSYAGDYRIVKQYMYVHTTKGDDNCTELVEMDANMRFSMIYNSDLSPITGLFSVQNNGKEETFLRDYEHGRIEFDDIILSRLYFDTKPAYLARKWDSNGNYFYTINYYNLDQAFKIRKSFVVKSMRDNIVIFSKLGRMFSIDINVSLNDKDLAKEFNIPGNYHLDIYNATGPEFGLTMQFITDETPEFIYLIIRDRVNNKVTVMRKNKSTGIISDPTEYVYEDKEFSNPLLNRHVVEYNGIPVSAKYNEHGIMTHYNNKSTRIEDIEDHEAYFYPAIVRRNRDFIFGDNLFYCDLYLGHNLIFTRALCVKK